MYTYPTAEGHLSVFNGTHPTFFDEVQGMSKKYYVGSITIYKGVSNGPNWMAYYRDSQGKQRRRSLKTTNISQAKERAREIDNQIRAGEESIVDRVKSNRTITFGLVLDQFLGLDPEGAKGPGSKWKESTKKSTKPLLEKMRKTWANQPIQHIDYAEVARFMSQETNVQQKSSWNRYRATLRGVFNFAVSMNYIHRSPADELKSEKIPKRSPKALTDEEYQKLYEHLPDYAQCIVDLLVNTGLRISQLFRLTWGDINTLGASPELIIRDPKNSNDAVLPISSKTAQAFNALRSGSQWKRRMGNTYSIIEWPDDSDKKATVIPEIDIKKSLYKASTEAGLGKMVTPHMFRHTWATRMRRLGVPLDRLMVLGGWANYEMVLRYADVPRDLRESMEALDQLR
jgi:integrase